CHVPEVLRIGDEQVNVPAVAVIEPEHEHRAAAEGPHGLLKHGGEMVRQRERRFEQRCPRAGARQVGRFCHKRRLLFNTPASMRMRFHVSDLGTLCNCCSSSATPARIATGASSSKVRRCGIYPGGTTPSLIESNSTLAGSSFVYGTLAVRAAASSALLPFGRRVPTSPTAKPSSFARRSILFELRSFSFPFSSSLTVARESSTRLASCCWLSPMSCLRWRTAVPSSFSSGMTARIQQSTCNVKYIRHDVY